MRAIHRGVLKISDAISWISMRLCALFLGVVVAITLVAVFYRYVLQLGLSWTEELSRGLNIWIIFLGASVGFKYSQHVAVEFLVDRFPQKIRAVFLFFMRFGMFFICADIAYYCFLYTASTKSTTPALMLHYAYVNVALFLGFVFMLVHLLEFILRDLCAFIDCMFGFDESARKIT